MTTLAVLAGYAITLAFVLRLLAAARRREEENSIRPHRAPEPPRAARDLRVVEGRAPAEALGTHAELGRLAETVHDTLDVERVTVLVSDPADPRAGIVAACFGAPGLLGDRVPVEPEPATGFLEAAEAAALGLGDRDGRPWAFAHLPIAGTDALLGAVTVAARREDAFDGRDLRRLERLARQGAPVFDRRHRVLIARATAE